MKQITNSKSVKRFITGFIFGVIALSCLVLGKMFLFLLLIVIVFSAAKEYVKMLENKGFYPSLKTILVVDSVFAVLAYFSCFKLIPLVLILATMSSFLWVLFKGRQPYIANVATTILGFLFTGCFPLHLLCLRELDKGLSFVVLLFMTIIITDIGCYYFGHRFGKHKLAPTISPNKTIEGSIGGSLSAILGAIIFGYFLNLAWYDSFVAGVLITVFAQLGDLSESLIKRDAGVKDSGDTLPGHGGFLDRCDSFIFTIPIAFYYFKFFVADKTLLINIFNLVKGLF